MHLFVYGTLKTGGPRHDIFRRHGINYTLLDYTAYTYGTLRNYQDKFPVLTFGDDGDDMAMGELYELWPDDQAEEFLNLLDEIEGVPYLFERSMSDVYWDEGEAVSSAVVYVGAHPELINSPVLESESWSN